MADLHCHTLVSQHAYSTITEYINHAKKLGLNGVAITDHGPDMPDGATVGHFMNLVQIPRKVDGIRVYKGGEANILDHEGNIDLKNPHIVSMADILIASYHSNVVKPGTVDEHTQCYLNLAKNPYLDILGHSGTGAYPYHHEPVIKAFRDAGKLIEINSNSFVIRPGAKENCRAIALKCKELKAPISVDSDCHSIYHLADVTIAMEMLKDIDFPEELIINTNFERLEAYIERRLKEKKEARKKQLGK